ncbi:MAG TPA: hypothetical protein VG710_16625 [Opitutus sp.]|nr:hypothetical protein [Opitutus sp.]
MTIHSSLLAPGLLLLLYPADWLLSAKVELRSFESFRNLDSSRRYRPWWWVPALWLDPFRGWIATVLLFRALELDSPRFVLTDHPEYWAVMGALLVGVALQAFTRRVSGVLFAPIGFTTGMITALLPVPVVAIALVAALTGLFAFRRFHAFFTIGLFAVAAVGLLLQVDLFRLGPAIAVLALPLGLGCFTNSVLEIPARDASGGPPRAA